jgi:general secretion pathway protein K
VVLVLVLVVTTIVSFLVLDLNANMLVTHRATHQSDRRTVAWYNARSAIHLARLSLVLQGLINTQLSGGGQGGQGGQGGRGQSIDFTPWSGMLLDVFSSESTRSALLEGFAGIPSDLVTGFGSVDGGFAIDIVDEDGRVDLNLAARGDESQQFLDRLLSWLTAPIAYDELFSLTAEEGEATTREQLVASLIDWADTNDQMYQRASASRGAEDNWYETLPDPYARKDMPYDSLEEVRLVRGASEDFWSTFVDPEPEDPSKRTLTVWGSGKINVNAAPPRVLAALVCTLAMDQRACDPRNFERVMLLLDAVREATGGRFPSPTHFVRMISAGTDEAPGIPLDGSLADRWLTTVGQVFSVYAVGTAPMGGRPIGTSVESARARERIETDRGAMEETERARREEEAVAAEGETAEFSTREVVVRLHVVIDVSPPWGAQGGRVLYWREL